jgi:hypothetical protein
MLRRYALFGLLTATALLARAGAAVDPGDRGGHSATRRSWT